MVKRKPADYFDEDFKYGNYRGFKARLEYMTQSDYESSLSEGDTSSEDLDNRKCGKQLVPDVDSAAQYLGNKIVPDLDSAAQDLVNTHENPNLGIDGLGRPIILNMVECMLSRFGECLCAFNRVRLYDPVLTCPHTPSEPGNGETVEIAQGVLVGSTHTASIAVVLLKIKILLCSITFTC